MRQTGYLIRMDDKPRAENQVLTHRYLSPSYIGSMEMTDRTSSIKMGWPTYEEAKEAWKSFYNQGLELGVDHKQFHDVTLIKVTIEEEKLEEL